MNASGYVKPTDGRSTPENATERLIGTASHVCSILDCFTAATSSLSLTEVTASVGLRKSSIHRLLRTLLAHRYLALDPLTRRYRLGERIGSLARAYANSVSVVSLARPYLERLRELTHETAALQTRSGARRQVVAQLESAQSIRAVIDEGRDYPLDAGAAGHLLRAYAVDWEHDSNREKLARIRRLGYAVSRGEIIPGAMAIYVPVPNHDGQPIRFVIGIQAPEFRATAKVRAIVDALLPLARDLGEAIPPGIPIR